MNIRSLRGSALASTIVTISLVAMATPSFALTQSSSASAAAASQRTGITRPVVQVSRPAAPAVAVHSDALTSAGVSMYGSALPSSISQRSSNQPTELGTTFKVRSQGRITAIRFFKVLGSSSRQHVGRVWSSSGTLLRQVTFTHETSHGWQVASLGTSLTVKPNTTLTVTYGIDKGRFSVVNGAFAHTVSRGPLVTASGAGKYGYGRGKRPTKATSSSYLVDVNFVSTSISSPLRPRATPTVTGVLPTISTTGWAASGIRSLKPYRGPLTITTDGTVLDGYDIKGSLLIYANNVTIKRSRILATSTDYALHQPVSYSGVTLSYVEIAAQPGQHPDRAVAVGANLTADHIQIHGTQRGVSASNGMVLVNSYVDGFNNPSPNHASAVGSSGDVHNVLISNNVLGCGTHLCSSAMSVYPEQGPNTNWTVTGNRFNGGSYCLYLGYTPEAGESPNTDIRVTNNTFGTKYSPDCGLYGPLASWSWSAGNVWTNNRWVTPGKPRNGTVVVPDN